MRLETPYVAKGYIFIRSFSGEGAEKFVQRILVCLLNYNKVYLG